jgi:hypothetical protein
MLRRQLLLLKLFITTTPWQACRQHPHAAGEAVDSSAPAHFGHELVL